MVNSVSESSVKLLFTGEALDYGWIYANSKMIQEYAYDELRATGHLPILDVLPNLTHTYNSEKETFEYSLELLAYPSGMENAEKFWGIILEDGVAISRDFSFVMLCDALS